MISIRNKNFSTCALKLISIATDVICFTAEAPSILKAAADPHNPNRVLNLSLQKSRDLWRAKLPKTIATSCGIKKNGKQDDGEPGRLIDPEFDQPEFFEQTEKF